MQLPVFTSRIQIVTLFPLLSFTFLSPRSLELVVLFSDAATMSKGLRGFLPPPSPLKYTQFNSPKII